MLNIVAEYLGHQNRLSGNILDEYLKKAIELSCPNKLIPLLVNHRALMYYPDPNLILRIFKLYNDKKNWKDMKELYNTISKKE